MIQALAALAGAALTAAACCGAGSLLAAVLRLKLNRTEWLPFTFLMGAPCLHLAMFLALALHIAYWPVLLVVPAALVVAAFLKGARPAAGAAAPMTGWFRYLFWAVFGIFSVVYFLHALGPEGSPDGQSYHLGLIARYLHARGFERITSNMYAGLGEGVEMLFLPAYSIGRNSAAALVHFEFALALALAMLAYGKRIRKPTAGMTAALLTYVAPVVGIDGTSAYIDVAVAAIVFGTFYLLQLWDENREPRVLIAVGLLAGYAYAAKYTAFVMLPFALGYVLWRTRRLAPLATVAAFGALMIAPWMIRDGVIFRDPVYPFANSVFRNPYRHVVSEQEYSDYYRNYDLPSLAALPLEVTLRGERTQGVLGPVFLLAPLALLALRYRAGRRLLAAGAVVFSTYFLNVGTRFLIPSLPFVSLSLALALSESTAVLATVIAFQAFTSWPSNLKFYADQNAWRLEGAQLKAALRRIPQDRYLRDRDPAYTMARMLDANVPEGEKVLSFAGVADAYTTREVLLNYSSAGSEELADILNNGWIPGYQPSVLHTFTFPETRVRKIRVREMITSGNYREWSVHEVRFFHLGVELPRRQDWRLEAWPNPWDVQMAFDNSPATRWRSWETLRAGMYIEADLGRPEMVDEVRLETSSDSSDAREQLQLTDESGNEVAEVNDPRASPITPPSWIRRAATFEMARRGVHYLLVPESEEIGKDIRGDPEGWGLEEVAHGYGTRLYRTVP